MRSYRSRNNLIAFDRWNISSALIIVALFSASAKAASPKADLDAPLENFEAPAGNELISLCRSQNIPCGEEQAHCGDIVYKGKEEGKLNLKQTSRRKALDEIAGRYQGYHWAHRDGVLNIEPQSIGDADLLSRKLENVSIHGSSSFKAAVDVLTQAKIKINGLISSGPPPKYSAINLDLKNVTVREALNAIVRADGQVFWSFCTEDRKKGVGAFSMPSWRTSGIPAYQREWKVPKKKK